jgi:hypothetical protein
VRKERYATLDEALAALEAQIGGVGRGGPVKALGREYEPVRVVAGRFELSGPEGLRAGVDVRADGSAEAYRGRIRKRLVERGDGESAVAALRRALSA